MCAWYTHTPFMHTRLAEALDGTARRARPEMSPLRNSHSSVARLKKGFVVVETSTLSSCSRAPHGSTPPNASGYAAPRSPPPRERSLTGAAPDTRWRTPGRAPGMVRHILIRTIRTIAFLRTRTSSWTANKATELSNRPRIALANKAIQGPRTPVRNRTFELARMHARERGMCAI